MHKLGILSAAFVFVAALPAIAQTAPTGLTPGAASSPGPTLTSSPVALSWTAVSGASAYEVQVERLDTFGWTSAGVVTAPAAGWTYLPQLFGQDYRFRVRAWDGLTWSPFSSDSYFHLNGPVVGGGSGPATPAGLTPGADSGSGPVISTSPITLAFDESAGATVYELATEYDSSGSWTPDQTFTTAQNALAFNTNGWFSTNRWRVRAGSASGWSAWSAYKYFTPGSSTGAANMTVTPGGDLNSSGSVGGPFSPASQSYTVTNTGTASSLFFTGATQSWYRVSPATGTLAAGESRTVAIVLTPDAAPLPAGSYTSSVTFLMFFTSATASRNVSLNISGSGLVVTPGSGLTSSGTTGGPFTPSSLDYTLSNTSAASLDWTASSNQTWVTLSSSGGSIAAASTSTLTASINAGANALATGTHSATITFTNTTNGAGNTTRTVTLTVNAPGVAGPMTVSPGGGLSSTGSAGGPFTPSSIDYTITNTGSAPMNWSASCSLGFVTLSATSGTIGAGGTATVTVTLSSAANSLPNATYTGSVVFNNTTNASGDTTRPVTLTIAPAGGGGSAAMSVSPTTTFAPTGPVGGPFTPSSQMHTITNTGSADLSFTVTADQTWVSIFAPSSTLSPGAGWTSIVMLDASANSLAAGTYSATVTFTNTTNGVGNTTVNVVLTVTGGGGGGGGSAAMTVTPAIGISATGPVGGPFTNSSQNYVITNTGTASLSWTASATQTWVTVLPTSGTLAPGATQTVLTSVNGNAIFLPAGTHTDTITFTNTTNGAGDTTRPVSLTLGGGGGGGGGDTTPPAVTIVTPAPPTASTSTSPITVSGTASDNVGVTQVAWTNAATGGNGTASGTTAWSASIPLAAGSNLITITATDAAGNSGSATITITYTPPAGDTTPPGVIITTPTTAATFSTSSSPITVGGTASDNVAVSTVTWFNAATGQSGSASGTTSWSALIPLATGSNVITVSAFDAAGNSSTDQITITLSAPGGGSSGGSNGHGANGRGCGGAAGSVGSLFGIAILAGAALAMRK